MKYLKYGNTGTYVSALAFGAMTLGEKNLWKLSGVNQETSDKMIKISIDAGINLFDTADVYDAGDSEIMLGRSLKGYRDQVMIATKVRGRTGNGVNEIGLSRHHMTIALRKSLERLGTEWIDIYQYHGWDVEANINEMVDTMQSFVDQGKVLYPAFSNFAAWQMAYIQGMVESKGYTRYESAQMNYNIINRDVEYEVIPFLKFNKMSLMAWSPLHGGLLTGKYNRNEKPTKGTRMGDRGFFFPYFEEDKGWSIVEEINTIAKEQGCKQSQVALSWLLEKDVIIILGARNIEQLRENILALDVKLTKEQMERLDKISSLRSMYPNWMIERQNQDRYPKGS